MTFVPRVARHDVLHSMCCTACLPRVAQHDIIVPRVAQHDIEHQMEKLSIKKSELSVVRKCFLGLLSGLWMSLAGFFAFSVAGLPVSSLWTPRI